MRLIGVLAAGLVTLLGVPVESVASCKENCVTKITSDFRGRPPFKRRVETLSAVDIAQVEVKEVGELVEVKTVDFKGRPPFKRRSEMLVSVDIAEVEMSAEEETAKPKRRRHSGSSIFKRQ